MPLKKSLEFNTSLIFFVISAICFIAHFLFFRYSFPPVNVDEASFFSPASSLAKHGKLSSDIHHSFLPGSSMYTYWMPPFYMVLLGVSLKIAGVTVFNAKVLSFILTCFSAFLISTLATDRYIRLWLSSLMLICPFIIITSAFIRVEALAILFIVLSIVAVRFQAKAYLIGVIAGLGLMTHPLMVPCCVGLALIMMRRGAKPFLIFSLIVLVTIAPYIYYILQDVALFKDQMGLQLLRKSKVKFSDLKLSYILQSVPISLLAVFCLYLSNYTKELRLFLVVAISLSLFIILRSNEFNYQVYLIPYVIAAVALVMVEKQNDLRYKYVLPILVYSFFLVLLASKTFKYHFRNDAEYKEMIAYMEANKNWIGKNILVSGSPDISTFLIMNNQQVEREIPVPVKKNKDWFERYNYIVEIRDNNDDVLNQTDTNTPQEKPWIAWKEHSVFTTSKGSHSMFVFQR